MPAFLRAHKYWILSLALFSRMAASSSAAGQTTNKLSPELILQQENQDANGAGFNVRVDVDLVTTDISVIGTPVSELRAEDFIVFDNGVSQKISYFSHDQLPLAVAVLVDVSSSITKYLPSLKIAAFSALRRLKPEDQVALFSFAGSPSRLCDLTNDRLLMAERISKIGIEQSGTNIYYAIYDAAAYLKKTAPRLRRAIILISDDCQTKPSRHNANSCRAELLETATTLYNLRTTDDPALDRWESPSAIKRFTEETGGQVLDVLGPTSLKSALEKAVTNFRTQYTLGFNPSNPGANGSFHRLAARLPDSDHCPGCRLLMRSGYYAGMTSPLPSPEEARNTPRPPLQNVDQALIQQSILAAGLVDLDIDDIPFKIASTAEQTDPSGRPQVRVELQIDAAGIVFKTIEDRHACRLRISVFYATANGKILGSDWKMIEGAFREATYNQAMIGGISYSMVVPLKTRNQMLKIVIFDEESEKAGSKLVRLQNRLFQP
jgi:VWFA-related protein